MSVRIFHYCLNTVIISYYECICYIATKRHCFEKCHSVRHSVIAGANYS